MRLTHSLYSEMLGLHIPYSTMNYTCRHNREVLLLGIEEDNEEVQGGTYV